MLGIACDEERYFTLLGPGQELTAEMRAQEIKDCLEEYEREERRQAAGVEATAKVLAVLTTHPQPVKEIANAVQLRDGVVAAALCLLYVDEQATHKTGSDGMLYWKLGARKAAP